MGVYQDMMNVLPWGMLDTPDLVWGSTCSQLLPEGLCQVLTGIVKTFIVLL